MSLLTGGALQIDRRIVKVPKVINPFNILHLSDLHFVEGSGSQFEELKKAISAINVDIDLMTWGGDLLSNDNGLKYLGQLRALLPNVPCVAILGNHDVSHDKRFYIKKNLSLLKRLLYFNRVRQPDELRAYLKTLNLHLLEDEELKLDIASNKVHFYGVKQPHMCVPHLKPQVDLNESDFNLLLVHRPDMRDYMVEGFDLLLGGHTHGGQIHLPFLGPFASNCALHPKTAAGHFLLGKTQTIVNNGFSATPFLDFRFGCPRQISVIEVSEGEIPNLDSLKFLVES